MKEFEMINRHFRFPENEGVHVGIGDDAAIVDPAGSSPLAVTTDSVVESVHFLPDVPSELLGCKSLSASLSDMAAMGASPLYATIALVHPNPCSAWLEGFAQGLKRVAGEHGMSLVGGDLTFGSSIVVNVTVIGKSAKRPLLRSGSTVGDQLWTTGYPGEALLGLAALKGQFGNDAAERFQHAIDRHQNPAPRVQFGMGAAILANAAIDTSDGLWKSLELLADASGVRLEVNLDAVPLSRTLRDLSDPLEYVLGASDDYELLLSAPPSSKLDIESAAQRTGTPIAAIGSVSEGAGVRLFREGQDVTSKIAVKGYEHWD